MAGNSNSGRPRLSDPETTAQLTVRVDKQALKEFRLIVYANDSNMNRIINNFILETVELNRKGGAE